ncbi:MAG: AAA family ATPase [Candidatus Bathyarchaeota archaeon]|nr:AAA family ATPase [Candidatus Bathyarchaeota archaeon]MDW8022350.1 ATPase domain-containing protein [Nitrososphaerota archaeon]
MSKKKKVEPTILTFKTAYDLMQERQEIKRYPTGTPIDELIGGGIEEGEVVEFYGEYGSGKTQIAKTLAVMVAGIHNQHVFFVDCEETFKPERIVQIAKNRGLDIDQTLKNIHVLIPVTSTDLMAVLDNIPPEKQPKLLIIDGLTTPFRVEYIGRETLTERQGYLRKFLYDLKKWAKKTRTAVIVTNQVYADPSATPFLALEYRELAVGGHTLYHAIDSRIFVRKGQGGTRIAKLVDSSCYPPAERPFRITDKGIEPPQEPKKDKKEDVASATEQHDTPTENRMN